MAEAGKRIAVYDLDRTVTFRPTYSLFLLHSAARISPLRLALAPIGIVAMLGYALKLLDRDRLKTLMWGLLLGRTDPQRLQRAIDAFTLRMLETNIRPGAREQIARDRAAGAMLVLATAAHEIYAGPIAAGLGFDAVLGTQAVCGTDGRVGPGLVGRNVYGDSKLAALTRFLAGRQVQREGVRLSFYSDSSSDRPAFEWADEAVAVNPSRKLARLAAERGWPILDWGRP